MYKEIRPKNKKYYTPGNGSNNNNRSRMDVHKFIHQQMMTVPPIPYEQVHGFDDFAIHDALKRRILDRMLDMGFLPAVKKINNQMRIEKQTLLFSATMDESQKVIVDNITHSPVKVTASSGKQLTHAIEQDVLYVGKDRTEYTPIIRKKPFLRKQV